MRTKMRIGIYFVLLVMCFSLTGCKGNIDDVTVKLGKSQVFGEKELNAAVDALKQSFADEYENCTLISVTFNSEKSQLYTKAYQESAQAGDKGASQENIIALLTDFETGFFVDENNFEAQKNYTDWVWILTRTEDSGKWTVAKWNDK